MNLAEIVDVVIVGGGPAGRAAALMLGRCLRNVTMIDASEEPLKPGSGAFGRHDGFATYDSVQVGCGKLRNLETVSHLRATVDDVEQTRFGFTVHCCDGTTIPTRLLLLTTDRVAPMPAITGAERFYGSSLHECPYCDGWEHRGRRIGVLGGDEAAVDLALKLLLWSSRVTLYSNDEGVAASSVKRLERGRVQVVRGMVTALEGLETTLERLRIDDASAHPCEALFFPSARKYHSTLAARLGCDLERITGAVHWRPDGDSSIGGLFVAGSGLNTGDITVIATGEGLKAAKSANDWLLESDNSCLAVNPVSPVARAFRQTSAPRRIAI